jgi:hypothetical protein
MNIQIKKVGSQKRLNRTDGSRKKKATKNVFMDEEDDEEDEKDEEGGSEQHHQQQQQQQQQQRAAVNRSIVQEQDALHRQQQQQSASAVEYDFDGTYEEDGGARLQQATAATAANPNASQTQDGAAGADKKARYIGELLKAAERRKRTHDLVYERTVAREQAEEEALDPNLKGKDRFITASYKQKLMEQKQWKEQEDEAARQEEQNDVTKRGTMAHFYGNFNNNVAVGGRTITTRGTSGGTTENDDDDPNTAAARSRPPATAAHASSARVPGGLGGDSNSSNFLAGFAKSDDADTEKTNDDKNAADNVARPGAARLHDSEDRANDTDGMDEKKEADQVTETADQRRQRQRTDREERVARARERFLLRHPELAAVATTTAETRAQE